MKLRKQIVLFCLLSAAGGLASLLISYLIAGRLSVVGLLVALLLAAGGAAACAYAVYRRAIAREIDNIFRLRDMLREYNSKGAVVDPGFEEEELALPSRILCEEYALILKKIDGMEKELDKHKRLFDNLPEGLIIADQGGNILTINPSARQNFLQEGRRGELRLEHVMFDLRIYREVEELMKSDETSRECVATDTKGRIRSVTISKTPLGEGHGVILFVRDITEKVKAERARSDFVANVSHELKTPLTSIRGFAELLELNRTGGNEEMSARCLEMIRIEADRLMSLINDILRLSELESIAINEPAEVCELMEAAENALAVVAPLAKAQSVDIKSDLTPLRVKANSRRIMEMMINLIDNAVKYNKPGGSVAVRLGKENGVAVIRVSDTGIGIPEADLERVFERFYRVDKSRSRNAGGTGLGLSIVKHTVSLYKGKIDIESEPGEGTVITVRFPLDKTE